MHEVDADGNCFFRAMCDQRWGSERHHAALRARVVAYMRANRDAFEPFLEDDEKWDAYVERMAEDGTWAGNVELQAASLVCMANVCVHQAGQPRWEIRNFDADRWFHVAYEGGDHYNSARLAREASAEEYWGGTLPGGPLFLEASREGRRRAARWAGAAREPSAAAVAAAVAESGGAARKRRAREVLRLFGNCVHSAAVALRAEVAHLGAVRGGVGEDDPDPEAFEEAEAAVGARGGADEGEPSGEPKGSVLARDEGGHEEDEEDEWEPVVTRGRKGGTARRGRRREGGEEEGSVERGVASLRI